MHYGRIAPGEAHDIFVRQALVTGEINTRASFVADNQKVLEIAREEEAAPRRHCCRRGLAGALVPGPGTRTDPFGRRPGCLVEGLAPEQRKSLHWSLVDLLPGEGSEQERYPKYLALGQARLPLHYRFEPGADDDGVTLDVPLHLLNALDPVQLGWLAPGFVADKASALIRSLPKLRAGAGFWPRVLRSVPAAQRGCHHR